MLPFLHKGLKDEVEARRGTYCADKKRPDHNCEALVAQQRSVGTKDTSRPRGFGDEVGKFPARDHCPADNPGEGCDTWKLDSSVKGFDQMRVGGEVGVDPWAFSSEHGNQTKMSRGNSPLDLACMHPANNFRKDCGNSSHYQPLPDRGRADQRRHVDRKGYSRREEESNQPFFHALCLVLPDKC